MSRVALLLASLVALSLPAAGADELPRPNLLWISAEDLSPDLGCYGDTYARTPHLDKFATEAVRYTHCFTHAGVCAPSRCGVITGMYPPSIGGQHMRCRTIPPPGVKCFSEFLREAGYYCTNNSKTDYQFVPASTAWDASNNRAHYRQREQGQPFFAVFNLTTTHESQARDPGQATKQLVAALAERHDPAQAKLPPFWADTPVVRKNYADYADTVSAMDSQVGELLKELEDAGLAENTIVWFWGDHGRGLTRCKRWLYDSGVHVPLMVRVPAKYQHLAFGDKASERTAGTTCDDLVAFIDFAPTMHALAGIPIPAHFHGQPFLGPVKTQPREFVYGHRDRMDETYDLIRMVRDRRYKYIRNFFPEIPYAAHIDYMDQMPMLQEMRRLHAAGELTGPAALFFRDTKPLEELYDTAADPHELVNLADQPEHRDRLLKMREELTSWMLRINDTGLLPEPRLNFVVNPLGRPATVTRPGVTVDGDALRLSCNTPGAGIEYALLPEGQAPNPQTRWHIWHGKPIPAPADRMVRVRAARNGFAPSPPAIWKPGSESIAAEEVVIDAEHPDETTNLPDLRRTVAGGFNPLSNLLELANLQLTPGDHTRKYLAELQLHGTLGTIMAAPLRWWAVRRLTETVVASPMVEDELRDWVSKESDPAVEILLARHFAASDPKSGAVEKLVELLQNSDFAVRLHAISALEVRKLLPAEAEKYLSTDPVAKEETYLQRIYERIKAAQSR